MALNEHEEKFLRRLMRDGPLPLPPTPVQPKQNESIEPIIEAGLKKGPLVTQDMDTDYYLISVLQGAGVLREAPGKKGRFDKKYESLGEFFSRTLLSRAQIIEHRKDPQWIRDFCAQAELNNRDCEGAPHGPAEIPQPPPR